MDEVEILDNSNYIGHKLEKIILDQYNLTLIGIIDAKDRKKFTFNPKQDEYILKARDILIIIGHKKSIIQFKIDILSKRMKRK
jgi:K+/H+ antiporter YhaU regulatory subunit KhtT